MKQKKKVDQFPLLNPNAAGIDIGSKEHFVAVPEERDENSIQKFGSFTSDLHDIAGWLKRCRITTVAMESTGVYWIPLFLILEEYGFEVFLVNSKHVKNVTGRKTDEHDSRWIQKLHSCGLLNCSFQPDSKIRELRNYIRHKKNLTQSYSSHILRIQKAFDQMNIKLNNVITDIMGKSGSAIIEAIILGERNAEVLAELCVAQIKVKKKDEVVKSLMGNWREDNLFELKQCYELYCFYKQKVIECEMQIERIIVSFSEEENRKLTNSQEEASIKEDSTESYLRILFGVDVTKLWGVKAGTAIELLSEIGIDMTKWRTEKHFVSWLGLAPNNKISGGKIIGRGVLKKQSRPGQVFRMMAMSIQRSDHYLAYFFKRIRAKAGPQKAIVATARKLAVIFYKMVKYKTEFLPVDKDAYILRFNEQKKKWLEKQAAKLGGKFIFTDLV